VEGNFSREFVPFLDVISAIPVEIGRESRTGSTITPHDVETPDPE
jgi:hypothetical protein